MKEFTAPSGAKVKINYGEMRDVFALKDSISKELLNLDSGATAESLMDMDASVIAKAAMMVDSSDKVRACIFKCLTRSTYDGQKITEETFSSHETWGDYYDIAIECIKVNLSPFLKPLLSKLSQMGILKETESPEQK